MSKNNLRGVIFGTWSSVRPFILSCLDIKLTKFILSHCTMKGVHGGDKFIVHNENNLRIAKERQQSTKNPAIVASHADWTKSDRSDCSRKTEHYFPFYSEIESN